MGFNFDPHNNNCPICQNKFNKSYLNQNFYNYFLECFDQKDHSLKILVKNLKIEYFNCSITVHNKNKIKIKVFPHSLNDKTIILSKEGDVLLKSTDLLFKDFNDLTINKEKLNFYLSYL